MPKKKNTNKTITKKPDPANSMTSIFNFRSIVHPSNLSLITCLIIVCILFIPTLVRPWLLYDERILAESLYFPVAQNISEFFEILNKFGLNFNIISSNSIYSSNYVIRNCPGSQILGMIVSFLLKKEPFYYHLFNLLMHLINTSLMFFILKTVLSKNNTENVIVVLMTILWAIHPVIMEPVLLSTNFGALFSYMFFFGLLLEFLKKREKKNSNLRKYLIPIIFFIPMMVNEYIVALPLVLFVISFYFNYQSNKFFDTLKLSISEAKPYLTGLLLYIIYFLFISHYQIIQSFAGNHFTVTLERIFWLSPQIFFHIIKLILYPKILSIDQTLFIHLGKTLRDPYSTFCIVFFWCWLLIPLYLFLQRKKGASLFLLNWLLLVSLVPYLHIIFPSYILIAERYLYIPLAILIFSAAIILKNISISGNRAKLLIPILSSVLIACFTRSYFRTNDWKNNYSFINSSYKTSKNPLFKAMRLGMLGKAIVTYEPNKKALSKKYFSRTLKLLKEARIRTANLKDKYQEKLPLVIKAYGLDYESILSKIAYLDASSRCLELGQGNSIGIKILKPFIKKSKFQDPRLFELYTHLLTENGDYKKSKNLLIKANNIYPHIPYILLNLFEISNKYEKNDKDAEKYLLEVHKYFPYDIQALLNLANFYQGQKKLDKAAYYYYLFGLRTQSKLGYQQALIDYLELNNARESSLVVKKLMQVDPNDPESLYFVSKYFYKVKDYQKALNVLIKAYSISKQIETKQSSAFDIVYTLMRLYLFLGNQNKAFSLLNETANLAGDNTDSLYKLASIYKSLGLTNELNNCIKRIQMLKH